jgi:Zn finger protein HypA/HybF involved in hydrogenase expression
MTSLLPGYSWLAVLGTVFALAATAIFFYHLGYLRCYEKDTKEEASRMDWECPECGTRAPIYSGEDLVHAWRVHDEEADCDVTWLATL